jgi:NitT/TauT family transport system ATP-binding protein
LTNALTLTDISKIYPGEKVSALNTVSLEIPQGDFFCIVGPSGCGKSTLLKILAGIEEPTRGTKEINGKVSMVFQSAGLLPWLSVRENVAFGMKLQKLSAHAMNERLEKYLQLVGLQDFREKYPRELSGGQRQRVGLARALAVEPEILLMDEPFSALDPMTTEELHTYILKIWDETKKTIVMVSHLLSEAALLADQIGVMKEGKLLNIINVNQPRPRTDAKIFPITEKLKKDFFQS